MISVIIPVYNAEKSIEKSLNSIKNQTWIGDFEIIIVDDGSIDQSKNVIKKFITENANLNIVFISQENGGVSKARNVAIKKATGDFIAFLDSDDEWLVEKTQKQMRFLENPGFQIDFLATKRLNHQLKYPYKPDETNLSEITFRKLLFRNEAQPSTVIFRRRIVENTGFFDDEQEYGEDLNYWLKISRRNKMYILNEELVFAGSGKRSFGVVGLSANLVEMENGFQKNLKEMLRLQWINHIEYLFYFVFYKLKYAVRISRNHYFKMQGK